MIIKSIPRETQVVKPLLVLNLVISILKDRHQFNFTFTSQILSRPRTAFVAPHVLRDPVSVCWLGLFDSRFFPGCPVFISLCLLGLLVEYRPCLCSVLLIWIIKDSRFVNSPRLLVPSRMHSVTDSVEVQLNMKSSVKTCHFSAV